MEKLLTKLASEKLGTYAAITLMFTYTFLLGRDFECSCKPQPFQCNLYMGLPFFIILLLILWTDRSFQRVCRYLCSCAGCSCQNTCSLCCSCSFECSRPSTCNFRGSFIRHILKAALVGLLWVAFVYLEGDWYVCCENDHSEQQATLACKAKDTITEKENETIAELRNQSRVIGGFTLFGIILVAFLIPLCRKCCEGKSSCCNRRFLFEKLILEEEDKVLKEILREKAKDQLTEKVEENINNEQIEKCFDVAVELIYASDGPTISDEQRRQQKQNSETMPLQSKQDENNQHEEQEHRMTGYQSLSNTP